MAEQDRKKRININLYTPRVCSQWTQMLKWSYNLRNIYKNSRCIETILHSFRSNIIYSNGGEGDNLHKHKNEASGPTAKINSFQRNHVNNSNATQI